MNKYVRCTGLKSIRGQCFKLDNKTERSLIGTHFEYTDTQFEEITQLEYLKSINLKDKLIELGNEKKYYFSINNLDDAIKLDKLFTLLDATSYKTRSINEKNIIEDFFKNNNQNFTISFNSIEGISHKVYEHIELTFNNILDYV